MLTTKAANAAAVAVTDLVATVELLDVETLIAVFRDVRFGAPSDGIATATGLGPVIAKASGLPTHARVRDASGALVFEVTDLAVGRVQAGADISIDSFTYTVPR